jgi:hypothetical protein
MDPRMGVLWGLSLVRVARISATSRWFLHIPVWDPLERCLQNHTKDNTSQFAGCFNSRALPALGPDDFCFYGDHVSVSLNLFGILRFEMMNEFTGFRILLHGHTAVTGISSSILLEVQPTPTPADRAWVSAHGPGTGLDDGGELGPFSLCWDVGLFHFVLAGV